MIFPLFPTGVNVEACGIYSLAILQGKAGGQKRVIMSSSPESVNKGCSLGKLTQNWPITSLELYCTHEAGWQVSEYFPRARPPHGTGKLLLSKGFWLGQRGRGQNPERYSNPTTHHTLLIYPSVTPRVYLLPGGIRIHDVGECFSNCGPWTTGNRILCF